MEFAYDPKKIGYQKLLEDRKELDWIQNQVTRRLSSAQKPYDMHPTYWFAEELIQEIDEELDRRKEDKRGKDREL